MSSSRPIGSRIGAAAHAVYPREAVRVADQILQILEHAGIDRIFGIPGGTISPLFDALLDHGIDLVTTQNETMAVYMAGGYARATGRPGVVAVTSGPGALNTVTGCASAYLDGLPLLILSGEPPTHRFGRTPIQEGGPASLDLGNVFRSITRYHEMPVHPERVPAIIEHALQVAMGPLPGPVAIQLPIDVTQREVPPALVVCPPRVAPEPPPGVCKAIAEHLTRAKRPLLLLGQGSRAPGVVEHVLELAEFIRCPVATDIEAKGVFPESHPLSLGVFGVGQRGAVTAYLTEGVDLVLTLGCRLDDTSTIVYSDLLRPDGPFIQVDVDPDRLARSYNPDIAIHADLATTLGATLEVLPVPSAASFADRDQQIRAARHGLTPCPPALSTAPHDPRSVPAALQAAFPGAAFTVDIGNHLIFASEHLIIDDPAGFIVGYGLAGMGSGIGAAIGLQLGYGTKRQVVSICGDGGLLSVGSELATCAKYDIPVVVAVFNDGALGMVQHGMDRLYGRSPAWETPAMDVVGYARALGCDALRIGEAEDLDALCDRRVGGPLVLDIPILRHIEATNPRVAACIRPKTA